MKRSGKHFEQSTKNDLAKIVKNLLEKKSFEEQPGGYLKEFHNIPRHPVNGHNLSNLCTWIDNHKKVLFLEEKLDNVGTIRSS